MSTPKPVHKRKRKARGIRMEEELWDFVDGMAEALEGGNTSKLIERWIREKRDAVKKAAA